MLSPRRRFGIELAYSDSIQTSDGITVVPMTKSIFINQISRSKSNTRLYFLRLLTLHSSINSLLAIDCQVHGSITFLSYRAIKLGVNCANDKKIARCSRLEVWLKHGNGVAHKVVQRLQPSYSTEIDGQSTCTYTRRVSQKSDATLIIFIHQHNVVENKTKICRPKTVTGL